MKNPTTIDPEELLELIRQTPHPLRLDDLLRRLALSRRDKQTLLNTLETLANNGRLIRLRGGKWACAEQIKTVVGLLSMQRGGAGFVTPEPSGSPRPLQDLFIPEGWLGDAWHGDLVEAALLPGSTRHARAAGLNPEGRILRVLRRGTTELAVRVTDRRVLRTPHPDYPRHLRRAPSLRMPAPQGVYARPVDPRFPLLFDVDVTSLVTWPEANELLMVRPGEKLAEGLWSAVAVAALGFENAAAVQERLVRLNHGIPLDFPPVVEAEAARLDKTPPPALSGPLPTQSTGQRRDLRELPFVTIDGPDARDFDDAICVEPHGDGALLWVAIADVSHYVHPRTALDREARDRGNSCYFPRSSTPMLPEVLSNDLCSLRPDEDRPVMAVRMVCAATGQVTDAAFFPGLICSRARLTYETVQQLLDAMPPHAPVLPVPLPDMLRLAARLASAMIEWRSRRGALDLDLSEVIFHFDDKGRVTDMGRRERLFSHRLIEAFMLAANEAVARFLTRRDLPFPLRAHPAPDPDRLVSLFQALKLTELAPQLPAKPNAGCLRSLLDKAADTRQAPLISRLILRAMKQARYVPGPAEPAEARHFGLASEAYCHFTSPIRRYADLLVHRALKLALKVPDSGPVPAGQKLLAACERCNERERAAQDAEREMDRRLACLLLEAHTGETFWGLVVGVTPFGLFVEPDAFPVDGMIALEALSDDWYEYDENRQELTGRNTGRRFRLGDALNVRLMAVNVGRLTIDFVPENLPGHPARQAGHRGLRTRGRQHADAPHPDRSSPTRRRPRSSKRR